MGQTPQREVNAWGGQPSFDVRKEAWDWVKDGESDEWSFQYKGHILKAERKENVMNGFEIIVLLFVIRVLLPLGVLMWIGEWVRRQNANYWLKM